MASKTQSEIVELLNTNFTKQELVQTLQDILKISKPTAFS